VAEQKIVAKIGAMAEPPAQKKTSSVGRFAALYIICGLALSAAVSPCVGADLALLAELTVPPELEEASADQSVASGLYAEMLSDAAFGEVDEAIEPAQRLVELTELEFGQQSKRMARPLTNLALIQESRGDLDNAGQNYAEAVGMLERFSSPVDRDLVTPLMGIGRVLDKTGRPGEAVLAYERARQILRRHEGLYTLDQIAMLDAMATSYAAAGNGLEADRQQLRAFDLRSRGRDDNSTEMVSALLDLAEWQMDIYRGLSPQDQAIYGCLIETDMTFADERPARCRRPSSRALYNRAIHILEEEYGKEDVRLVAPLRGLASTYYARSGRWIYKGQQGQVGEPGYEYQSQHARARSLLERALDIQLAQDSIEISEKAELLMDMGDWYTVFSQDRDRGMDYYREAWSVLRDGEGEGPAAEAFAQPKRLAYSRSPAPPRNNTANLSLELKPEEQLGFVLVEYTVTPDGQAQDVQIIETSPPGWVGQERAVLRSMRTARFRPRMEEGEPVATSGIQVKHEFRYVE